MDRVAAIRTFGKASYCPCKVKIYSNRWYRVVLRDVITRLDDYYGLSETVTEEIVPGEKARMYRDCQLNRCDAIVEHTGPVYRVSWYRYGDATYPETHYVASQDEAEKLRVEMNEDRDRHFADLEHEIASYARKAEQGDAWYQEIVRKCSEGLERAKVADWQFTVERVR